MGQTANVATFPTAASDDGYIPLLPPGEYSLAYQWHETWYFSARAPKLAVWFQVIDYGPHFGALLPRYYNVKQIKGRPRKNGEFKAAPSSDLVREYARLLNKRPRLDRMALSPLKSLVVRGRVRTVTKDRHQKAIPEPVQYSAIDELLEAEQ